MKLRSGLLRQRMMPSQLQHLSVMRIRQIRSPSVPYNIVSDYNTMVLKCKYLSDTKQVTEFLKCSFGLVCKDFLRKHLTKLHTFLVEAVHVPQEALEHDLVFEV